MDNLGWKKEILNEETIIIQIKNNFKIKILWFSALILRKSWKFFFVTECMDSWRFFGNQKKLWKYWQLPIYFGSTKSINITKGVKKSNKTKIKQRRYCQKNTSSYWWRRDGNITKFPCAYRKYNDHWQPFTNDKTRFGCSLLKFQIRCWMFCRRI